MFHSPGRCTDQSITEHNGRTEKIYVPFAVLTGMVMDNDVFSNVEVSSGKVINDGERTVVSCFIAFVS